MRLKERESANSRYVRKGQPCSERHELTIARRSQFIRFNLNLSEFPTILEIGTGLGAYAREFSTLTNSFLGVDIDEDSVRSALASNRSASYAVMNGEMLALKDNSIDCILMIEVIEHILDDRKAIEESHRVLKENGRLIMTAPNRLFPFETHGIRIGQRILGSKGFGFPFVPWLPVSARKHLANARVYTLRSLERLLEGFFEIENLDFMKPSLDQMGYHFPRLSHFTNIAQKSLQRAEISHILRNFMPTITVCARKK